MIIWVPVEKLFLDEIGFDAASMGVMAAAYAAVVPFLEIPSGILADRWSRRNVLILANVALVLSSLVGGLSTSVAMYLVAALLLGVFFAMQSGTTDSIIYDTVLEETGDGERFERTIGRLRMFESIALVGGALAGGWVAALTSTRVTYFLTVPLVALSVPLLMRLREPRLHRSDEPGALRSHVATTFRTILDRGTIRPVIVAMILSSLLLQALLEFGPLWMVALAAPAFLFGPQWAGLMGALGIGGALGGRLRLGEPATLLAVVATMLACGGVLVMSHQAVVVIGAQVVLALLIVAVSIPLTHLLHEGVPSTVRAGVASGVGTLTWMAFLPFALVFGFLSRHAGVHVAGWLIVGVTAALSVSLARLMLGRPAQVESSSAVAVPVLVAADA